MRQDSWRGHATRFVLVAPSPTLPRKREREQTEIAATAGGPRHLRPLIPRKRESSPSFQSHCGSPLSRATLGPDEIFFDYTSTTLLTTYRAYARRSAASLIEGVVRRHPEGGARRGVLRQAACNRWPPGGPGP